jgi:CheY-like chemotaxis protein
MPCVLIVDDDADTRDSLREILTGEGFAVRVATSGNEVIDFLRGEEAPGVILLDDQMPRMTGGQVLDWMCMHPEFNQVPAVLVSGDLRPPRHQRAAAVLRKPFTIEELLDVARRFCEPDSKA